MKTFVIGDIHGGYKQLKQCLERSGFNYAKDRLISLGDVTDGWPDSALCIEELTKIKNLVKIFSNHDEWAHQWFKFGATPHLWLTQGGKATIASYQEHFHLLEKHLRYFEDAYPYFIDEKNRIFVHGGFYPGEPIRDQAVKTLMWDRSLCKLALEQAVTIPEYKEVFLGHTTTWSISPFPINSGNIWLMDQGGGNEGKLSIMNVDTKEFWQSDLGEELYHEVEN